MRTKIVRTGDSRWLRIPKPLLEETGLEGEVEPRVVGSGILIEGRPAPREGWKAAARRIREHAEDGLLDDWVPTDSDETEWRW